MANRKRPIILRCPVTEQEHDLIQYFEPGETTPEQANEIGKQLADTVTKGQYEYVLTTNIDKRHIHNHIMFCAVNFIDYQRLIYHEA